MTDLIIERLRELFISARQTSQTGLSDIVRIFYGDPVLIPESDLPAIVINPDVNDTIAR